MNKQGAYQRAWRERNKERVAAYERNRRGSSPIAARKCPCGKPAIKWSAGCWVCAACAKIEEAYWKNEMRWILHGRKMMQSGKQQ